MKRGNRVADHKGCYTGTFSKSLSSRPAAGSGSALRRPFHAKRGKLLQMTTTNDPTKE